MSKELTPLEAFKELRSNLSEAFIISDVGNEKFDLIETELKRISILEKEIEDTHEAYSMAIEKHIEDENEYIKWVQKGGYDQNKLKTLDIITKKNVDLRMFREEFVEQNNEYNFYLENYDYYHYGNYKDKLTQEEFDLLKEVLL